MHLVQYILTFHTYVITKTDATASKDALADALTLSFLCVAVVSDAVKFMGFSTTTVDFYGTSTLNKILAFSVSEPSAKDKYIQTSFTDLLEIYTA